MTVDDAAAGQHPVFARPASPEDLSFIVESVQALVCELSGTPDRSLPSSARAAAARLVEEKELGLVLVACAGVAGDQPVGMVSVSFQSAVRTGGAYATVQELYVVPPARDRGVGGILITCLLEALESMGIAVVEVGLPAAAFADEPRTRAFYADHGFRILGHRMRRSVSPGPG